jgi:hypothetical protein
VLFIILPVTPILKPSAFRKNSDCFNFQRTLKSPGQPHDIITNGNIGLNDSGVQQWDSSGLTNLLHQTGVATNWLAIP